MSRYLLTYNTPDREHIQQDLFSRCAQSSISYIRYSSETLRSTSFYLENKKILDEKRGAGYWLWKPYIIYETLLSLKDGDILLYQDIGDQIDLGIFEYLENNMSHEKYCLVLENKFNHGEWTKRDCFHYMGCDKEYYWSANQVEAGLSAWYKNDHSINFCMQWLNYCKMYDILGDEPNTCGKENLPGFKDHRHDQSILTNLVLKTDPKISDPNLWKYVNNNVHC